MDNQWIKLPAADKMLTVLVVLQAVAFDAIRDGNLHTGWWQFHVPKWIAFYTPLIYIVWMSGLRIRAIAALAFASWILWSIALECTPAQWDGSFMRVLKWIGGWIL